MATFIWSSLANGQNIAFNANADVLRFDDLAISAASVRVTGDSTQAQFIYGAKTVTLAMDWYSITTSNITFTNGSLLVVGDNTTGTSNDDANNTLAGGNGNDQLIGMGGADVLVGGEGDDVFLMAGDRASGAPGSDTILGGTGEDRIVVFDAGASSSTLAGTSFDVERIIGTSQNDTFQTDGGFVFDGGAGNDDFRPPAGAVSGLAYDSATAGVSVNLATHVASDGLGGTDTFQNILGVEGSRFDDVITGSNNPDGTVEFFQGMAGNDAINGAGGVDRVDYTRSPSSVVVDLTLGTAQDGWGGTDTLSNIEQVRGSAFSDTLIGNSANNRLEGMGGNDVLVYTGGMDVMDGGSGTDTADFSRFGSAVWVNLLAPSGIEGWTMDLPTVTGESWHWRQIADLVNIENIVDTAYSDQLYGDNANNRFTYTSGYDTVDGAGGTDTVSYSGFRSAVWVSLAYESAWTMDLPTLTGGTWREIGKISNVENLIDTAYSDKLFGNDSNNVFTYTGGFDTVDGAGGSDTVDFSGFGSAVWVSLAYESAWTMDLPTLAGGTWREIGKVSNIENLVDTIHSDKLFGNESNNVLSYTGGLDTVDGGGGTDTIDYSGFGSAVWVNLGYASAWTRDVPGLAGHEIGRLTSIENVIGTSGDDSLTGDGGANRIEAGAGNDVLNYTGGYDVLDGGTGTADTVDFSGFGSAVWVALTGAGIPGTEAWTMDLPTVSGGTWREIADVSNVESLVGTVYSDKLYGDSGNNVLSYTGGYDVLDGGGGNDTADFSKFGSAVWVNLNYEGSNGWTMDLPTLTGGTWRAIANVANTENLVGTSGNDFLAGDVNANRIEGGAGNDTLTGGGGADQLTGGAGVDRFDYNALSDAGDTITDFTAGAAGDVLDIRDVLVGYNAGTSNLSDFVQLVGSGGNTIVNVNADGIGTDFVSLTTLQGIGMTGTLLNDMLAQGNLAVS